MTSSELPEDHSQWPKEPWRVLGVERNADELTVKRAYTQLIRRFKPEHFPEQFQKIREAYDALKDLRRYVSLYDFIEPQSDNDPDPAPPTPRAERKQEPHPASSTSPAQPPPRILTPEQQQRNAWTLARNGNPAEGYAQLKSLVVQYPKDEDLYLRLYWLLTLFPEVDAERSPSQWLITGLQTLSRPARLLELFQRDAEREPELALSAEMEVWLSTASIDLLPNIADIRWLAASSLGKEEVIISDLDILRKRLAFDHNFAWCRLLMSAIQFGFLVQRLWHGPLQDIIDELEETANLHQELRYELDRLEQLVFLAEGWKEIQQSRFGTLTWLDLIRRSYFERFASMFPLIQQVVAGMAANPSVALGRLYKLFDLNFVAAEQMRELLNRYHLELSHDLEEEEYEPSPLCAALLERQMYANDEELRKHILEIALTEFVDPVSIARKIPANQFQGNGTWWSLSETISEDSLLQAVYQAIRTFWR